MKILACATLALAAPVAFADDTAAASNPAWKPDMGKLLATGGVSNVEGTAGGGITPWALIGGYGTRDSYGANVHDTYISTQDFQLNAYGAEVGIADRVELSVARQDFKPTDGPLNGLHVSQNIFGVKVKVIGDALYDQDNWLPQIAVGAEYKRNGGLTGLLNAPVTALGAKKTSGTDYYVSATKIFLDQSLLANVTLRETEANQMGLLGFGGDLHDNYRAELEGSLAYLLTKNWVLGAEYREKPHNLSVDNERAYYDAFVAWFPTKNVSLTLAYANLGSIVAPVTGNGSTQSGVYLSLQAGF
ncbi:MAG: DUF3034 family protein [Burkholderiaceae bacterium]|nr:DUF3034 family protein [Burkholderiaceae bacterium]